MTKFCERCHKRRIRASAGGKFICRKCAKIYKNPTHMDL